MFPRLAVLLCCLTACTAAPAAPAQLDPPFPPAGPVPAQPHVYPVEQGWFDGRAVEYYNLGANTPANPDDAARVRVEQVWMFVTGRDAGGNPIPLPDQHNLFDTVPGDPNYSDLWQLFLVTPPDGYTPDSLTSADALKAAGPHIEKQPLLVNCPIVPAGSTLADSELLLKQSWVKLRAYFYFDFGPTSARPGKVYAFVQGFDSLGGPQLVPGQHFVFDHDRAAAGYSDFWIVQWVAVDSTYTADSVRAVADIHAPISASNLIMNYPQR